MGQVLAGAVALAAAAEDVGLPPRQSLTVLLTTESLIFAAFSVAATLALPTEAGRSRFFAQGRFAYLIVIALFAIAAAAMFALYATVQPELPNGVNAWVRVFGVAVGIAIQPFAAWTVASAAKKTKPGILVGDSES
jgi:hypothetical protein